MMTKGFTYRIDFLIQILNFNFNTEHVKIV